MVDAGIDCNVDTEWINRDWIDIDKVKEDYHIIEK
jgi:hypothetical protein